jgi:hypothetical protein
VQGKGSRAFSARKLRRAPSVPVRGLVREIRTATATACTRRAGLVPFAADAVIRPSTDRFAARSRPIGLDGSQTGWAEDLDGRFTSPRSARGTLRESTAGRPAVRQRPDRMVGPPGGLTADRLVLSLRSARPARLRGPLTAATLGGAMLLRH